MNKLILSLILGIFLIGLVSASVTTTLNQPTDGSTATSSTINYNVTGSTTGAYIKNITLYTNQSGTFASNGTFFLEKIQAHGLTIDQTMSNFAFKYGAGFVNNRKMNLNSITKESSDAGTNCYILDGGANILNSSTFTGDTCPISYRLSGNTYYIVATDCNGGSCAHRRTNSLSPSVNQTFINWTWGWNSEGTGNTNVSNIVYSVVSINLTPSSADFITTQQVGNSHIWNALVCDNNSACSWATNNFTLLLDRTPPSIAISSPSSLVNYGKNGGNLTLNFTATDSNLANCWYSYNNTNTSIGCTSGVLNSTQFILSNQKNLTVYANDTAGNINSSIVTWDYKVFENSINYSTSTTSGSIENFALNLTYHSTYSGISVVMNYNNTNYTMASSDLGYTKQYTTNILTPSVQGSINKTFYFYITLSNSSETIGVQSINYNQTVSSFLIDNCGTYSKMLLNFSMVDEESLIPINGTILINTNIYSYNTSNLVNSYNTSISYYTNQSYSICLANISQDYTMSYTIQHYGNSSYFKKYRNIQSITINNNTIPQQIKLYNLLSNSGNTFKVIVVGNLYNTNGNANLLVDVQRQYINLNDFYSVESAITSASGEAITHLTQKDQVYNFIISYYGLVIGTFNNYQVQCQNEVTGQCSITLNLAQATANLPDFSNYGNITQSFLLDNNTNILYQTFSATDGSSHLVNSLVIKNDGYGNNTICDNSVSGTSGTIQCNIPTIYQNTSFYVQTIVDGDLIGTKFFSQGVSPDWKGADILIELLMISSLVLLFIAHPITLVIGAILGLLSPILLIAVQGASLGNIIMAVIFYIIAGVLIIIVSRRKM